MRGRGFWLQALQRGLPRPENLLALPDIPSPSNPLEQAEALMQQELLLLLQHEAAAHPVKERRKGKKRKGDASVQESAPLGPLGKWEDIPVRQLLTALRSLTPRLKSVCTA